MKTITHKMIPFGLGFLATLPAFAIEPPKDVDVTLAAFSGL